MGIHRNKILLIFIILMSLTFIFFSLGWSSNINSPLFLILTITDISFIFVGVWFWAWFLFFREKKTFPISKVKIFIYSIISLIISFIYRYVENQINYRSPLFYISIIYAVVGIGLGLWFWIWFFVSFRNYGAAPLKIKPGVKHAEGPTQPKLGETGILKKNIKNSPQVRISIHREYEFIGGQVRFKMGLVNNTNFPLTSLNITLDIPIALKWILHEPDYIKKGDSLFIPKLGAKEEITVSLYLEPINCVKSSINATVSYFDETDKLQAITMKPKEISITCPIFFTDTEANLARVKRLHRSLTHLDKKVFPITDPENSSLIFSTIISELGKFDIKLISKEFVEKEEFGEAWYYAITKVKKNRLIIYILLDGKNKILEIEVSGNKEDQITAFLAEIGDRIRRQLIDKKVINSMEQFNDMRIFILSNICPICYETISEELVQKFLEGEGITCENCYARIPKIPVYVRKVRKFKSLYQTEEGEN